MLAGRQALLLRLDLFQVFEPDRRDMAHWLEQLPAGTLAITEGHRSVPIGLTQGLWQDGFKPGEQRLGACDQVFKFRHPPSLAGRVTRQHPQRGVQLLAGHPFEA